MRPIRIGTRGSALALWQARAVAEALGSRGVETELVTITTRGDRTQNVSLMVLGGKGVFVTEIHEALARGDVDLAVHSAKDMPAVSPAGISIAAVLQREDPRDALIMPATTGTAGPPDTARTLRTLSPSAVVGTGSPRRIAQLRRILPASRFEPIRGNVDTRLRKLDTGEVDALVLACAGLRRLGLAHRISAALAVTDCLPAPGQGIIAIEARHADERTMTLLAPLNHRDSRIALAAEQALVAELGGGCQLPLGAYAEVRGDALSIRAVAASLSGTTMIEQEATGHVNDPMEAGRRLAHELAARGARELLNS